MHIKRYVGCTLAGLALPVVLATFLGMDYFSHKLVDVTGIKVSPKYTGGEIQQTIDHDGYQTKLHQSVFAALIGESQEGFIQIDWSPVDALPPTISEEIDYDNDGIADFRINYDKTNNTAALIPYNPKVVSLAGSYILKERRTVRVNLHK
jgi:hypothetical protein